MGNPLETLDRKTQLHQRVEILYVVTGWRATFLDWDGDRKICYAEGNTILDALITLNAHPLVQNYSR